MISSSLWAGWGLQENTRAKLQSVLQDLCGEDCKLEIFQEDRSDEIIVSGNYVEGQQKYKKKHCLKMCFTRWGLVTLLSSR